MLVEKVVIVVAVAVMEKLYERVTMILNQRQDDLSSRGEHQSWVAKLS